MLGQQSRAAGEVGQFLGSQAQVIESSYPARVPRRERSPARRGAGDWMARSQIRPSTR
jgi:hypothetical protein